MTQQLNWRDTLTELVAENTVSSADPAWDRGNRGAAEKLANRLQTAGFDCQLVPLPDNSDKVNLIARIGGSAEAAAANGLVFAGHIDTVPFDADAWTSDPFTLSERNQRLYGLGSSDMKGFVALAASVAAEYAHKKLSAPVTLLASADEECGMDGARALQAQPLAPGRHCVIGEPTGLVPIRRHKGIFMERITVHGASGHSSNPALGANAIDAMHVALSAIYAFRDALAARLQEPAFPVAHTTLNPGAIHGGDNANRIPPSCHLDMDLRFLPGLTGPALRQELHDCVRTAVATTDCSVAFEPLFDGTPAFETGTEAAIVRACEQLSGAPSQAVDFGTEGPFYNAMGMETVILGPGDIEVAHQPDEYLGLERIAPMEQILHGLVQQFCLA